MSEFGIQNLFNPVAPKEGRMSGPQGWGCHQRLGGDLRPVRVELRESPQKLPFPKKVGRGIPSILNQGRRERRWRDAKGNWLPPPKVPSCHTQGHSPLYSLSDSSTACYPCLLRSRGILEVPNHGDFPEGSSSLFCIWAL